MDPIADIRLTICAGDLCPGAAPIPATERNVMFTFASRIAYISFA